MTILAVAGCGAKPQATKPQATTRQATTPAPPNSSVAQPVVPPVVDSTTHLALLVTTHEAYAKPDRHSPPLGRVPSRRPLTGERTALPVLGRTSTADASAWLHVALPGRPNGHSGWISRRGTVAAATQWRILVDLSARRVTIFQNGRPVRSAKAVVGKPSTPTPLGAFFVEESISLGPSEVGAPFALALSARSDVFQQFDGGPGQIALHGLTKVGGVLGTAASHGCVRLDNGVMRWLVKRIRPGTTVTIRR